MRTARRSGCSVCGPRTDRPPAAAAASRVEFDWIRFDSTRLVSSRARQSKHGVDGGHNKPTDQPVCVRQTKSTPARARVTGHLNIFHSARRVSPEFAQSRKCKVSQGPAAAAGVEIDDRSSGCSLVLCAPKRLERLTAACAASGDDMSAARRHKPRIGAIATLSFRAIETFPFLRPAPFVFSFFPSSSRRSDQRKEEKKKSRNASRTSASAQLVPWPLADKMLAAEHCSMVSRSVGQ